MDFESKLEDALSCNSVYRITLALHEEKSSPNLLSRLDKVTSKELDKNEFDKVFLILRSIENVCEAEEDIVHMATEFLKAEELKHCKNLLNMMEEFYDVCMSICRVSVEGKYQIQDIFVLRFGAVVIDDDVLFNLRLEAIRTINSLLDRTTKEERKKLTLSKDHCLLLTELAKVILDVGDYEMQVAISEALCRMTTRKLREDLVYEWFPQEHFAESFKSINDREFETDCRKFLNTVNSHFGDERRVFTFPCIKAFLGLTELFKPNDDNLDCFWIDFNLGTSSISFFVNDPEGALWESINLPKSAITGYVLIERDDQKILTMKTTLPITHNKIKGKIIQIIFESKYDIQTTVQKVFGDASESSLQSSQLEGRTVEPESLSNEPRNIQIGINEPIFGSTATGQTDIGNGRTGSIPVEEKKDVFKMNDHSDTEVNVAVSSTLNALCKGLSCVGRTKRISFVAALRMYQVAKAKSVLFRHSGSSNGSSETIITSEKRKESNQARQLKHGGDHSLLQGERRESFHRRCSDYTRKRPKVKSKLRILPLSSASSDDEANIVKHSTPKVVEMVRDKGSEAEKSPSQPSESSLDLLLITTPSSENLAADQASPVGPHIEETELGDSVFARDIDQALPAKESPKNDAHQSSNTRKRKSDVLGVDSGLELLKWSTTQEEQASAGPSSRKFFIDIVDDQTKEKINNMLVEDSCSETKMGSEVLAAFQCFKIQLKEHFASRFQKIETQSMESLDDCKRNVTSLLNNVHKCRLNHLETFQTSVLQELGNLEKDCHSLMKIETDTESFWKAEVQTVTLFCEMQQKRLHTLQLLREDNVNDGDKMQESTVKGSNSMFTDETYGSM